MRSYVIELKLVCDLKIWCCYLAEDQRVVRSKDHRSFEAANKYGQRWVA